MIIVAIEVIAETSSEVDRIIAAAKPLVTATRKDKGCLHYSYGRDVLDPTILHVTEKWQDEPSMRAHMSQEHTTDFLTFLRTVKIKAIDAKVYDASGERDLF